jgi:iron-sulfur cluster assembly protein
LRSVLSDGRVRKRKDIAVLTLSNDATLVIRNAIENAPKVPDTGGLRLVKSHTDDGQARLSMALADTPEIDDQIVEREGARVFVEAALSDELADKQLDIAQADDGRVRFRLDERAT